ncbi:MerR family transcriptional regulator [Nocardioides dubius]|uniref:MerR family transcriptional regulator n=1 Tax=Nocardioides dubius TaxID=317019 RepID=A0ABN1TWF5_9ACTN
MSTQVETESGDLLTIDELAATVGMTVRTVRYYATLGLLPTPERRGRIAYYGDVHRARLEMVRALQEHGFTLQAIEGYMTSIDPEATVEELVLRRSMLIPWSPAPTELLSRADLEEQAGRKLTAADLDLLVTLGAISRVGKKFEPKPALRVSLDLIELDIPTESMGAAGQAIARHMDSLVEELTTIMRQQVVAPFRSAPHTSEEALEFERTVKRLRQLTIEAVVTHFQRSANEFIAKSLNRPAG